MARKRLSDKTRAYGTFLANFLNCKLKPNDISALFNKCLDIMRLYLGYENPQWHELQIKGTFCEFVSQTEHGFFRELIAPYFSYSALGGFHPYKDSIFDERRLEKLKEVQKKINDAFLYSWGTKNDQVRPYLIFWIDFALLRKNFRRLVNRIIKGGTLEQIRNDPFLGDFILRLKSEYFDLREQISISGNQIKVSPLMTDPPKTSYSFASFLNGYLFPCLSYCLMELLAEPNNIKRIARCNNPLCKRYIFSKTLHKRNYCNEICKSKHQTLMRNPEKWIKYIREYRVTSGESKKRKQIDESEIRRIMKITGGSWQEVEEMLRDDKKM